MVIIALRLRLLITETSISMLLMHLDYDVHTRFPFLTDPDLYPAVYTVLPMLAPHSSMLNKSEKIIT